MTDRECTDQQDSDAGETMDTAGPCDNVAIGANPQRPVASEEEKAADGGRSVPETNKTNAPDKADNSQHDNDDDDDDDNSKMVQDYLSGRIDSLVHEKINLPSFVQQNQFSLSFPEKVCRLMKAAAYCRYLPTPPVTLWAFSIC